VNIADQFEKIRVFFADDGFVPVLKKMPCALMSFVEGDGVTGHEFAHDLAEGRRAGAQEKVKMIRDQGPGVTLGLGFFQDASKPFQETLAILVVQKELATFDSPGHDVLEKAGGIKSGLAGHENPEVSSQRSGGGDSLEFFGETGLL